MLPSPQGSFRLFSLFGITAYLHWTWLLAAFFFFQISGEQPIVFVAEYVGLFLIVLMHEFGHALACRSVKGKADTIVLFPLGGVAYVQPPQRPGAVLWSVVAGPLVNVVLVPVLFVVWQLLASNYQVQPGESVPVVMKVVYHLMLVNGVLLVFNLFPIYPLDGGQIVQSILWFFVGYRKSLQFVATIGMIAAIGLIVLGLFKLQSFWMVIMAAFIFMQALKGYAHARMLAFGEQVQQGMNDMQNRMHEMFNQHPGTPGSGPGSRENNVPPTSQSGGEDDVFDPHRYEKKKYMDE
ncbi:MAG TPA: peptidase M50 [Phycisphaerales bacterium]|nr:peptidase M50 [Phycisphaerales bacterium]|tara:strand:+ start:13689 stop:14570 length:882 start_codon:yes stop_codon:yes gene_type:complete